MPLRDHFRPPVENKHSWDELHGMWPAVIVQKLIEVLPEPYFAAPGVHPGTLYEVDIGTYRRPVAAANDFDVAEVWSDMRESATALLPHDRPRLWSK